MKGFKGSINHLSKVNCDWLEWSEERIFYVPAGKNWDVIFGSPMQRHDKAFINTRTMSVSTQPPGQNSITLSAGKTTASQKTPM